MKYSEIFLYSMKETNIRLRLVRYYQLLILKLDRKNLLEDLPFIC